MKRFLLFLALFSICFSFDSNFQNHVTGDLGTHFATDMQFSTDYTLSLVSGGVSSGDQNNLKNGDTVCSGSVLRVSPQYSTKWAITKLDILSIYPDCEAPGDCPAAMINGGAVSNNPNIKWLAPAAWDDVNDYGNAGGDLIYDWSDPFTKNKYNELGTFLNQPVSYLTSAGTSTGKEAGVNVFCKGNLIVYDKGTPVQTQQLPASNTVDVTLSTQGDHQITATLANANCFGAIEKHPTEQNSNPKYYYIYLFNQNQPVIGAVSKSMTIKVAASGGVCQMHKTKVEALTDASASNTVVLKVTMKNDGDQMQVTGVSRDNTGYTVAPFDPTTCGSLGIGPSLCPADNGFNKPFTNEHDLYVAVIRNAGASGGLKLTFTASTVSTSCGGAGSCSDEVDLSGPITCQIDPSSLDMGTQEVAQFLVACYDLGGDPMSCIGDNWYWADGLSGGFVSKSNSDALAYTTTPPGSSGTLRYRSGIAMCYSDITTRNPIYECALVPASASLNFGQSKYFTLHCFVHGSPSTPDDAEYDLINSLTGTLSNESVNGAGYTAPNHNSEGDLQGFGIFNSAPGPFRGAVGFSHITVQNGSGNQSNQTNPNDPGATEWCTIGSGPLRPFPGFNGWLGIKCGKFANETCHNIGWSTTGGVVLINADDNGTWIVITGAPGTSGQITAAVNNDPNKICWKPFFINKPECWEFT